MKPCLTAAFSHPIQKSGLSDHKPQNAPDPEYVIKKELYALVPEPELVTAAHLLVNEKFNEQLSFWKHIDEAKESIALNLRKLFLSLDFTITNNPPLQNAIEFVKNGLENETPVKSRMKCNARLAKIAMINKGRCHEKIHTYHI